MSRNVSATFVQSVNAQETNQVFLVLLLIDHSSLTEPIRIVNNFEDISSNGATYIGCPFAITFPSDLEDQLPAVTLSIDNVDRQIVAAVRNIDPTDGPATSEISVVLASSPDTIEVGPMSLTLREVSYDAALVTGTMQPEDILNEPYPGDIFSPGFYPGLF